jgi:pimeloyl-ACP methyl ester carboxylesterase
MLDTYNLYVNRKATAPTGGSSSISLGQPKRLQLPQGAIAYRERGENLEAAAPIVFVHGLLANADLWRKVVPELAGEFRCIAPDWPLGSHELPMNRETDLSPPGVAAIVAEFLEALDLRDVLLVGNDSGGAICQLLVTTNPERVGRLVLTSCDAFEVFPPRMFKYLSLVARIRGASLLLAQSMRIRPLRRLPIAYGALTRRPIDPQTLDSYVTPMMSSRAIRRDTGKFLRSASNRHTLEASSKLANFDRPVLLAWDDEDRFFKWELAERLAAAFPNARLERIPDSGTFVPEDQPERLAQLIAEFARAESRAGTPSAGSSG